LHSAYELVNPGKNVYLFYNKFRPVNRINYIKCGVNSSLFTQFWLLPKVCAPWITVLS